MGIWAGGGAQCSEMRIAFASSTKGILNFGMHVRDSRVSFTKWTSPSCTPPLQELRVAA